MNKDQRQKIIRRVTFIGACLDGVLALIKIVFGWLVHSPALIADGFHSLSDLLTDVAVVAFSHWAQLAPDDDHPYGHHRYETLGTVILGTTLIVIASFIAWDSVIAIIASTHVPNPSLWAILIAAISIVSKEWIFRYTLKAAKKVKSNLMEANAWHSRSDAFSSIVVLIGVVATWFGYAWVELLAAIGVAILIGHMGVKLTWNATQDLVDRGIEPEEAKAIEETIQSTPGVVDVHMLRSRMMGNHIYLDVHIQVDQFSSVSEGHFIAENVMRNVDMEHDQVSDITVHVDHEEDVEDDSNIAASLPDRQFIQNMLNENSISPSGLQIHYLNHQVMLDLVYSAAALDDTSIIKKNMQRLQKKYTWLKKYRLFLEE